MSWDLLVMNVPAGVAAVADLPKDFEPEPLGTREEVLAKIRQAVPEVDFTNPSWGFVEGEDYVVEFNVGEPGPVPSIMLNLRGGAAALEVVNRLLAGLDWRALDVQSGELYSPESAEAGFGAWREWRDRALKDLGAHQAGQGTGAESS